MPEANSVIDAAIVYTCREVNCVTVTHWVLPDEIPTQQWVITHATEFGELVANKFAEVLYSNQLIRQVNVSIATDRTVPTVVVPTDNSGENTASNLLTSQLYIALQMFGELVGGRYIRNEWRLASVNDADQLAGRLSQARAVNLSNWLNALKLDGITVAQKVCKPVVVRRRKPPTPPWVTFRPWLNQFVEPVVRVLKSRKY